MENPKLEHPTRAKKILFVREFCYSHYSIPLLYFFSSSSRLGFVGSKLFSELGGFWVMRRSVWNETLSVIVVVYFFIIFPLAFFTLKEREKARDWVENCRWVGLLEG